MGNDKTQIGPRVDEQLADTYNWLVRDRNNGKYKGRLAKEASKAYKAQIGLHAVANPEAVEELRREQPELADFVENECLPMHRQIVENSPYALSEREAFDRIQSHIDDSHADVRAALDDYSERLKRLEDVMFDMYHEWQAEKRDDNGS